MNINTAFPSTYLKAADLDGRELTVTISEVVMMDVGDEEKPVIYFTGSDKGLVANKTNAFEIADSYGEETESWSGRQITLYTTKVPFQGKLVDAIRVRVPSSREAIEDDVDRAGEFENGVADSSGDSQGNGLPF